MEPRQGDRKLSEKKATCVKMNTATLGSPQLVQPSLSQISPDPRVVGQLDSGSSTRRGSELQTLLIFL